MGLCNAWGLYFGGLAAVTAGGATSGQRLWVQGNVGVAGAVDPCANGSDKKRGIPLHDIKPRSLIADLVDRMGLCLSARAPMLGIQCESVSCAPIVCTLMRHDSSQSLGATYPCSVVRKYSCKKDPRLWII
jgi:hypothetical protein